MYISVHVWWKLCDLSWSSVVYLWFSGLMSVLLRPSVLVFDGWSLSPDVCVLASCSSALRGIINALCLSFLALCWNNQAKSKAGSPASSLLSSHISEDVGFLSGMCFKDDEGHAENLKFDFIRSQTICSLMMEVKQGQNDPLLLSFSKFLFLSSWLLPEMKRGNTNAHAWSDPLAC